MESGGSCQWPLLRQLVVLRPRGTVHRQELLCRVVSNEDCDLQVSEKGTGGTQVTARGSYLRGAQGDVGGEVAKKRMRSVIQGPAKKVRENKSVCL